MKDGSLTNVEIGHKGEDQAEKLLEAHGWVIIERGDNRTPWDIRAEKGGDIFAINVKKGKDGFKIGLVNVQRLLSECVATAEIPAYLFLLKKGYVLFILEEGTHLSFDNRDGKFNEMLKNVVVS